MRKQPTIIRVKSNDTLGAVLAAHLGGMSQTSIKQLLARRVVNVDGVVETRADLAVPAGAEVVIEQGRGNNALTHPKLRMVYEDDYLIVVEKQCGLLTVAANPGGRETTALSILKDYVRREDRRNGVFVVHRLDRETSGLLVFAKTQELQNYMREWWHDLVTKRTYVAVVEGRVEKDSDTITTWLTVDNKTTMVYSSPVDDGGKKAVTHYKVIKRTENVQACETGKADCAGQGYSLLELNLETGRTNQIRVHMASIGHPVVSDRKYGFADSNSACPLDRLALHARILEFTHPVTEQTVHFETPVPRSFLALFH
ncbi:MAG: RluA family pseudouridine synthase [Paludibacteraceae bacterium]|nr:RluA family pseudouridine synthase [Paludibacteraceae bacterium]